MDTPTDPSARSEAPAGDLAGDPAGDSSPEPAKAGFLADTMAELRRVVWPSRQQLISESLAVLLMVTLSAAAIASLDRFFHWLARAIFR